MRGGIVLVGNILFVIYEHIWLFDLVVSGARGIPPACKTIIGKLYGATTKP